MNVTCTYVEITSIVQVMSIEITSIVQVMSK